MAAVPTSYQRRLALRDQLEQLIFLVADAAAKPTPANVDAAILAADGTSTLVARPTRLLDGESYDWTAYRQALISQLLELDKAIQRANPYMLVTSYHT